MQYFFIKSAPAGLFEFIEGGIFDALLLK